jgi:L-ornithine Nalpha-acyltransferase
VIERHTGPMQVRLAETAEDVRAAQALRYAVFHEEFGIESEASLDADPYDALCDHLLVTDGDGAVVGTYRLLRQDVAERHRGFYSSGEYDLRPLLAASNGGGQLLELGRSCVAPAYRNAGTIALLWRGIAAYLERHRIGHMFGCASFPGTDPDRHAAALSYLSHHHLAPPELRVRAHPDDAVDMARLPLGSYDTRLAARALPPLIKGYLRVGATVGSGAFVDHRFRTTDVFVVMPVERISARYSQRFRPAA